MTIVKSIAFCIALTVAGIVAARPAPADTQTVAQQLNDGYFAYRAGEFERARGLLQPLAEQGNAGAQAQIGNMYMLGNGVPKDVAIAMTWFKRAAAQGNPTAQAQIGGMYERGDGVRKNFDEAAKWYKLSADGDFANGQALLARCYLLGWGGERDDVEAARLFRVVAEKGFPYGQYNLASLLAKGRGVERDVVEADMWFRLAGRSGHPSYDGYRKKADEARRHLEVDMSFEDVAVATALAAAWKPTIPCQGVECLALP